MSLSFWIRDYIFLPLAVIRRELWWRYFMLVVSMVMFGIWHKASLLFVLWGGYHGVLLVLHRQIQNLRQRLNWAPPERAWAALSWITSTSLIALGWLFFRANSPQQVREMLAAVTSVSSYASQNLSHELYWLVIVLAAGYAAILATIDALDRYEVKEELSDALPRFLAGIARNRWYWVPTLYVLAALIVFMFTVAQGGSASQLIYRQF
jgi:D-alanyl-lipoteichoic acid acyltransferase DltB (MBOAT superfamily)